MLAFRNPSCSMEILFLVIFPMTYFCTEAKFNPSFFDVSVGKCDGVFQVQFGRIKFNKSSNLFIGEVKNSTKDQCQWNCTRRLGECWMIEYLGMDCRFYKSNAFEIGGGRDHVEVWTCSKPVCVKFTNRCSSYWVGYDKYKPTDRGLIPVDRIHNTTRLKCRTFCEKHKMCGSLAFHCFDNTKCPYSVGNCTLFFGYLKPLTEKSDPDIQYDSVTLRCCDEDEIFHKPLEIVRVMGKEYRNILGQWEIAKYKNQYQYDLSKFHNIIVTEFRCLNADECIKTCSEEPFCLNPIFINRPIPSCYLSLDPKHKNVETFSSIIPLINNTNSVIWEWKPYHNKMNESQLRVGLCLCFRKGRKLLIKKSHSFEYTNVVVNSTVNLYLEGRFDVDSNINGNRILNMNDGHHSYTISVDDIEQDEKCELQKCDDYREVIYNDKIQDFISRSEWLAGKPKEENTLSLPIDLLIILNTYRPYGRCFSKSLCSSYVRKFQKAHFYYQNDDLIYNFLIGDDGRVYEGRGWNLTGAHTRGYNLKSIGVAFIGWFEYVEPSSKSLVALRNLIQYGIKNKYLKSDLKIVTHRDLRSSKIPGAKLHQVIQSWPFMNLSQMITYVECDKSFDYRYFIPIVFVVPLMAVLFSLVQKVLHYNKACCRLKTKLLSSNCEFKFHCENMYEMEWEKVNLKIDSIFFCHEHFSGNRASCNCFNLIHGLWMFCMIYSETYFMEKLHNLLNTSSCSHFVNIYVEVPKLITDSKFVILLHSKKLNLLMEDNIPAQIVQDKSCMCKRFMVKRIPLLFRGKMSKRLNGIL